MAKQYKSKYTGAQIDKAVGDVLEGRVGEVPAERKVGGVNLENDTANLQSYTWAEGQTMAQKMSAMEQDIDDKQAKIDENNKLSEELVDGLTDDLADKVEKTTEIGGVQIGDGIDTVQNLIYSQEEVTTELPFEDDKFYSVKMSDIDIEYPSVVTPENTDIATSNVNRIWLGFYNYTYHNQNYIALNYNEDNEGGLDLYYHPSWNKWVDADGEDYTGDPLTFSYYREGIDNAAALNGILVPETVTETVTKTLKDKFDEGLDIPLANQIYDKVPKEIQVKINLVDNETYKFKKQYDGLDFASFDFGVNYGKMESGNPSSDIIILQNLKYPVIQFSPFEYIDLEHQRYTKYYIYQPDSPTTCHWFEMVWDDNENDYISTFYDGDIEIVYSSANALTTPDLFSQTVLDLTKTETILEPRTLREKNEDLRNWAYTKKDPVLMVNFDKTIDWTTFDSIKTHELIYVESLEVLQLPVILLETYQDNLSVVVVISQNEEYVIFENDYEWHREGYDPYHMDANVWYFVDNPNAIYRSETPTSLQLKPSGVRNQNYLNAICTNTLVSQDISLDEHLKNYPNWEFEDLGEGILSVPKWDLVNTDKQYTYFYSKDNVELEFDYRSSDNSKTYFIRDFNSSPTLTYLIINKTTTNGGITAQANTWYLSSQSGLTPCDTPNYVLDKSVVSPLNINMLNGIYGERKCTLKEKIESLENSESSGSLKDQEYGEEKTVNPNSSFDWGSGQVCLRYNVNFGENLDKVVLNTNDIIYESDDLLVTYYYNRNMRYPYGEEISSGFLVYISPEEMPYDYQIINRNNTTNKWAGMNSQDDCSLLEVSSNEQWSNCLKYLPIAQQESAPYYRNCYNISGYEEVSSQPAFWALTYTAYYYYDNDNQEYIKFSWSSDTPEFSAQTVYTPTFSSLSSQPTDWANIYYNGDYYYGTWDGSYNILNSLLCRVNITTPTLAQKFASEKQSGLYYQTTLPDGPNTNGLIKVVVCNEEPDTKYEGYMYIVIEN